MRRRSVLLFVIVTATSCIQLPRSPSPAPKKTAKQPATPTPGQDGTQGNGQGNGSQINIEGPANPGSTGPTGSTNLLSCKTGNFSKANIDSWVSAAGARNEGEIDFYVPPELLTAEKTKEADLARVGAVKALFHTANTSGAGGFRDISDGHCAVYRVDLKRVWGAEWQTNWGIVASARASRINAFDGRVQRFARTSQQAQRDMANGLMAADRLAYNVVFTPNYMNLTKTPDSIRDIRQSPARARGAYDEETAIPCGTRILNVRTVDMGDGGEWIYYVTGDPGELRPRQPSPRQAIGRTRGNGFFGQDFPRHPQRRIQGSESILIRVDEGQERLPIYHVWRGGSGRGTVALTSGVIDPANPHFNYQLVTGRSCISCHGNGIRGVMPDTVEMGNGWSDSATMKQWFDKGQKAYVAVMTQIADPLVNTSAQFKRDLINGRTREPVAYLISRIEGPAPSRGAGYAPGGCYKYRQQIQSTYDQVKAQTEALKANETSDSGTQTPSTGNQAQIAAGKAAFDNSCATSGCHANRPVLGNSVPANMVSRAGLTGNTEVIQQINLYLQSR